MFCRLLPRFKVDGWCPHLQVLTVKLELEELLPTTISDSMILRKFPPAPLAPPPGSALLAGSAGAQLLLDGVIAREQEWHRQLEAARSGGRVLTEKQRIIASLGSSLQRYAEHRAACSSPHGFTPSRMRRLACHQLACHQLACHQLACHRAACAGWHVTSCAGCVQGDPAGQGQGQKGAAGQGADRQGDSQRPVVGLVLS